MHDTRLVHVKVVQGRFISVLPPSDESIHHNSKFVQHNLRTLHSHNLHGIGPRSNNSKLRLASEKTVDERVNPTLLVCRRIIDAAVHDAKETLLGEPTDDAMLARAWLEEKIGPPIKKLYQYNPAYKSAYKLAYYMSFEWCCHWLNYTIESTEEYRKQLTAQVDQALALGWIASRRKQFEQRMKELIDSEIEPITKRERASEPSLFATQ
jgi:hypothetical protein